jgi:hypothetical protein
MKLFKGTIQNVILEKWESQAQFTIHLTEPDQLYVQVNSQQADVDITVYAKDKLQSSEKYVWHGVNNFVRLSYANETATPYLEFFVVIKSKLDKSFTVVYDQWGKCAPTNINQALLVDIPKGSYPRCFEFYISKPAPLVIVAVDSYFDRGTGQNTIFLEWNQELE